MPTPVRLSVGLFAAIAFAATGAAARAAEPDLFPGLRLEDFPPEPDSLRVSWVETRPGFASALGFHHWRNNVGFPSLLTAEASFDPRSGERSLKVVRVDEHCLRTAEELRVAAEEACLSMTATALGRGVERLVFRSRHENYQVQFTMAQSPRDEAEWTLVPTGRAGEPRLLRMHVQEVEGGQLGVEWKLSHETSRGAIDVPLSATLPLDGSRAAGLSSFEAGVVASVELFHEIAQFYLPWVVMNETQLIDEGIPSPEENDPSECELVGVCGAEYETCTPTPYGWLGCNIPSDLVGGGWGGGFGDCCAAPPRDDPQPDPPEDPLPDWRAGSGLTDPRAAKPRFNGMVRGDRPEKVLSYSITSVLQVRDTVSKAQPPPAPSGLFGVHVVLSSLANDATGSPSEPFCREGRMGEVAIGTPIPVGDTMLFNDESRPVPGRSCPLPVEGHCYKLKYELDPFDAWDEGPKGEANNVDWYEGVWCYDGHSW